MNNYNDLISAGKYHKEIDAYKELYYKYHGRLVLFANKFTGDLQVSQDLVQDAFLKLWERSEILSGIDSPKSYLFQAVRNGCINHHRHFSIKQSVEAKLANKMSSYDKSAYFNSIDPLQSLLELEIEDKIEAIIQSMPEKCRQVFKMSRYENLKNKQISAILGISIKMVEKQISKALVILRSGLSDYIGSILIFLFSNKI